MKKLTKMIASISAISMLIVSLGIANVSAAVSGTPKLTMDTSEYKDTLKVGDTFNVYVNVEGDIALSKTDNKNLTGISSYTVAVKLPDCFGIDVEDGTDPYEIYEDIADNNTLYSNAGVKAVSYKDNTISWNLVFNTVRKTPTDKGTILTIPVTVKSLPVGQVKFTYDTTTLIQITEYADGNINDQVDFLYGEKLLAEDGVIGEDEPKAEITGITIDPETVTVKGGETQEFTVEVAGTGDYDKTYALTATAGTFDGNVFTAPEATDAEQTITITATANGDTTKTATATVTVPAKEPEKDFTFEAADDIYVGETKDAVKVFNCNINKADFSKMVVFTFTANKETKSFNGVFSGFDGETGLKNFSVLMFNAPADLTLDSITQ